MAHVWKTVCKSGFFPDICMHWRDKTDVTRFSSECLYLLSSLGSLHSLSLTEVHMHPFTMVLNKIFLVVCLYIMYYTFIFVNKYLIKCKDYYIILKIFLKFIYFILFMNNVSAYMSMCHLHP